MEACGSQLLKYLLFAFNLLFFIAAFGIIVVGALGVTNQFLEFSVDILRICFIVLIVVGVFILIVAFLACCGAASENRCMLIAFAGTMITLVVVEGCVSVVAYLKRDDLQMLVSHELNSTIDSYKTNPEVEHFWDFVQFELKCCGINGPADWRASKNSMSTFPPTCIEVGIIPYQEGCLTKLVEYFESHATMVVAAGISIILIQLVGIVIASRLASAIRAERGACKYRY